MYKTLALVDNEILLSRDGAYVQQDDDTHWEEKAACNGKSLNWFSSDPNEKYAARAICQSQCSVRFECISTALNEKHIHGIWGGVDDYEIRRALSVDAFGKEKVRARAPRCPYCTGKRLDIAGTKTRAGYKTVCLNPECGLTWNMAVIPAKLKTKKSVK
jgi:hypothetical protein